MNSDYFKIREIVGKKSDLTDLAYLKGKNIFSVDLRSESKYILESYPDYSKIKLVRVLPNRIFVDFIERQPIALVKLYRYFALDEEGTLFDSLQQPQEPGLPVISGLETKIFGPKSGRKYNFKEITLALNIIKEVKRNKSLKGCQIERIDVSNLANASIFLPFYIKIPGRITGEPPYEAKYLLEVRIGQDDIKDKVLILSEVIQQAKNDLANIKYIDLRFKEAVIKLKDAK
jgi:hypothetical protein